MKRVPIGLAAAAALGMLAAPAIAKPRVSGEEKLARLLEGRVAGTPRDCISMRVNRDQQVIDRTAVVYGRGKTIWVNVPHNARDLDDSDAMLIRTFSGDLCRQDIVTTFDTTGGFYTGNVFLSQFVPYTRVD